jgi:hypothetical protein
LALRERFFSKRARKFTITGAILTVLLIAAVVVSLATPGPGARAANPSVLALNSLHHLKNGGEADRTDTGLGNSDAPGSPAQELYDNLAFPNTYVGNDQAAGALSAFQSVSQHSGVPHSQFWQQVGPITPSVPSSSTQNGGAGTTQSGRETALAVANTCGADVCRLWVGAAGGGIWATNNGLAQHPSWHESSDGLTSNAIGAIVVDPTDASGRTLYVGTGEPNGASDAEAGVGLFKSTDYGAHWTLVSGSVSVAAGRSIGAIAIDPTNANHLYIGTAVARHGSSSVNGGRFTPPGAPQIGLYESTDGGATWTLAFSDLSDPVNPASPNGSDFFRGGVTGIALDPSDPSTVYLSMFDYGIFRKSQRLDGDSAYHSVFASAGGGSVANSSTSRTQFALAPNGSNLRIYATDAGSGPGDFYRVDNANVSAATLLGAWTKLSNPTPGTPGFSSYNFCGGQCWYDMVVASPPGQPDVVYIAGQMQYGEINGQSNGRTVQRSTNAGVSFTDMTGDRESPSLGMHPDQHAIVFAPGNPDIGFFGSDGGVVRTSGDFVDASSDCAARGLSGADLTDCQTWLNAIPTRIFSLNDGLVTLQFQSVTLNPQNPTRDVIGGTQDNGTWAWNGPADKWFESIGGDGGQSVIDEGNPNVRMHTFTFGEVDVNFQGTTPLGWDWTGDPLLNSGEAASFYVPLIGDPTVSGTMFVGLQHVWRTQDNGGSQAHLDSKCNEFLPPSQFDPNGDCGDWVALGTHTLTGGAFGSDKGGSYVVAITRAPSDTSGNTLWAGTRRGRLFISTNAAGSASGVTFTRIDSSATPTRFISGIQVDPANPYHAFVSFSGYNAYATAAGTATGHVFDVVYNPTTHSATWTDISHNLGDLPITGIALDGQTGNLFASTDFGVLELASGATSWQVSAPGMPPVATYGLAISSSARILYAATHGRGIWSLNLG